MRAETRREIARLLDSESGTIHKAYGDVRVALVYPNSYRLGMSNLGFQTVYGLINRHALGRCERSFLFEGNDAVTLESGSTLSSFDVVAFSVSFELDYPHIPEILRRAGIPPREAERDDRHPLVMAGGAAVMLNPEPIADFVDACAIGEAETALDAILSTLAERKQKDRRLLKEQLARLDGVYVPCFYRVEFDDAGRLREVSPTGDVPCPVRTNPVPDIREFATTTEVSTPNTIFGERLLVEVSRGCPGACKFCGARQIYRPFRWRSAAAVKDAVDRNLPGRKRVGLMGAAIGDHPEIEEICSWLVEERADLSLSSVRAGRVTPRLARLLAAGGVKTLTVAPEGGSERMREEVGKKLSDRDLIECARRVKEAGIPSLKVYFIVGLPGEERADVERIVAQAVDLSSILRVKVSVSPFVPKPRTPYERMPMRSLGYLRDTLSYLKRELSRLRGVTFTSGSPRHSHLEATLSRGNRATAAWIERGTVSSREAEALACRRIPDDEVLPWDVFRGAGTSCPE